MIRDEKLAKAYKKIVESKSAQPIKENEKKIFEKLFNNEVNDYLKETSFAGDQATIGKLILPTFRRSFPIQFAKELVGVQPLDGPNGYIFSLRYNYSGNSTQKGDLYGTYNKVNGGYTSNEYTSDYNVTLQDFVRSNSANSCIVEYNTEANRSTDTQGDVDAGAESTNDGINELNGFIVYYTEGKYALVAESGTSATVAALKAGVGTGTNIRKVYDNEAAYQIIFKSYSGPFATATGEVLGMKIPEMDVSIDKHSVEAKTRKMKSRFTIESEQDLRAVQGLDMATQLIDILKYEHSQGVNREIIAAINSAAAYNTNSVADFDVSAAGSGRWQAEYYRASYTEILRRSNNIAETTFMMPGNFIIASPDVCTMLEQLPGYSTSPVAGTVETNTPVDESGAAMVGNLGGRFRVYRDIFNDQGGNYATIGLKKSNMEAGLFYAPYIPLMSEMTKDQETGNRNLIFMERSAIFGHPMDAKNFYVKISFSNIF